MSFRQTWNMTSAPAAKHPIIFTPPPRRPRKAGDLAILGVVALGTVVLFLLAVFLVFRKIRNRRRSEASRNSHSPENYTEMHNISFQDEEED